MNSGLQAVKNPVRFKRDCKGSNFFRAAKFFLKFFNIFSTIRIAGK